MSTHLLREFAPVSSAGWDAIESDAKSRLSIHLAARKLVDFEGPHGWTYSATDLGRVEAIAPLAEGFSARLRQVRPLVEVRAPFRVARSELDDVERGSTSPNFDALDVAARQLALSENTAVFHGYAAAGITGIAEASPLPPITLSDGLESWATSAARAVDSLRQAGIGGPYGLALSPAAYTSIIETTEHGGYPLLDHLRQILDGPVVWAPGVGSGIVLSLRGGDYVFESGQDISIGYLEHSATEVQLYLEESFTFRINTPEAAVALVEPS
jgi:uncharacterized linocin/CFP29 family protein